MKQTHFCILLQLPKPETSILLSQKCISQQKNANLHIWGDFLLVTTEILWKTLRSFLLEVQHLKKRTSKVLKVSEFDIMLAV